MEDGGWRARSVSSGGARKRGHADGEDRGRSTQCRLASAELPNTQYRVPSTASSRGLLNGVPCGHAGRDFVRRCIFAWDASCHSPRWPIRSVCRFAVRGYRSGPGSAAGSVASVNSDETVFEKVCAMNMYGEISGNLSCSAAWRHEHVWHEPMEICCTTGPPLPPLTKGGKR
jgi:hypothetical protein